MRTSFDDESLSLIGGGFVFVVFTVAFAVLLFRGDDFVLVGETRTGLLFVSKRSEDEFFLVSGEPLVFNLFVFVFVFETTAAAASEANNDMGCGILNDL